MHDPQLRALHQQLDALQQRNIDLEAQLAQRQSNEHSLYRFVFDNMDIGCCIIEFFDGPHGPLSDYKHILTNAACMTHAGLDPAGKSIRQVAPDQADFWVECYSQVLRSGEPAQLEHCLSATGRVLALSCFRIEPATAYRVAVLFKDVTEQRRADAALQLLNQQLELRSSAALAERRLFAELVDHSIANVHVIDRDRNWLAINRQARLDFQQLCGKMPRVGQYMPDLMTRNAADRDLIMPLWERALAGERITVIEGFGEAAQRRHYELRFNALRDPAGTIQGAYLFAYDVSERVRDQQRLREAGEALRQAQKMEAVGQLSGGIAHDFNNLLGAVLGAHELMQQRIDQRRFNALQPLLATANGSAQRASSLVHRLLAFSRKQTLLPQAIRIDLLVGDIQALLQQSIGHSIELRSRFPDDLWAVFADPPQLESAVLNLCINARDALPAGGQVLISGANCSSPEAEQMRSLDLPTGDYVRLTVSDNGTGMSQEVLQRAVEPFFTTKLLGEGTGLGLSMVYGFVRQSGGQVHIQSLLGEGTSVHLYLPRRPVQTPAPAVEHTSQPTISEVQPSRIIMLVEDQPTMRMVIVEVLEDLGHHVHVFETGTAALDALQGGLQPDLLISDIGLPGGLDGCQLAEACQQLYAQTVVLFITAQEPQTLPESSPLDEAQILLKPFTLASLAQRVTQLLNTQEPP
ncbi:PAS domain-containing protein [Pseudomonas shirazensis]|uniref:PAS domain-containing protein n=1 Tax=Pseudomonas shirazensis TaxID=2745494 RepID=UPI003D29579D